MRRLLIIILCFTAFAASSQSTTREQYVCDRDGKTVICRLLVNKAVHNRLYLIKWVQKRDSARNYIATFYLGNKDTLPLSPVKVVLKFNKAVVSVTPSYISTFNSIIDLADDHLSYIFKAATLNRDTGSPIVLTLAVKSREKVITDIIGVDGEVE